MGDIEDSRHNNPQDVEETPLSEAEREAIIRSVISTQMLAGIEMDYDTVARLLDEVYAEPMPKFE